MISTCSRTDSKGYIAVQMARGTAVISGVLSIIGGAHVDHLERNGYDLVLMDGHRPRSNVLV